MCPCTVLVGPASPFPCSAHTDLAALAEPQGADDCARGFLAGERITNFTPHTIADGLRTPVGELNWPIIKQHVSGILTVSEEVRPPSPSLLPFYPRLPRSPHPRARTRNEQEIIQAQRLLFERLKAVVEPSGAVAFAAVRSAAFQELGVQGPVVMIISGGNVDLSEGLPWMK